MRTKILYGLPAVGCFAFGIVIGFTEGKLGLAWSVGILVIAVAIHQTANQLWLNEMAYDVSRIIGNGIGVVLAAQVPTFLWMEFTAQEGMGSIFFVLLWFAALLATITAGFIAALRFGFRLTDLLEPPTPPDASC